MMKSQSQATISTHKQQTAILILTAAGSSTRMASALAKAKINKKEYLSLQGGTVLSTAASVFLNSLQFDLIIVTYPKGKTKKEDEKARLLSRNAFFSGVLSNSESNLNIIFVPGGDTRQSSVYNALEAANKWLSSKNNNFNESQALVFIHDGARPFVTKKLIISANNCANEFGAAVPALEPVDTQKEKNENGFIVRHLTRSHIAAVQTPQVFLFYPLLAAHRKASESKKEFTDDTEIWDEYAAGTEYENGRKLGHVKIISGDAANKKITWPEDIPESPSQTNKIKKETRSMIHTGLGYDKHILVSGRKLMLGGIHIPFEKGEDGHSDGDVLLHSITDALLGASGMGDIGSYFPPTDQKWKDADSCMLLKTVWNDITNAGWHLINIDCVIALEQPKFLPFREKVINKISEVLNCNPEQVFVKAKTGEKTGDVGTGKVVEVWSTCLLEK